MLYVWELSDEVNTIAIAIIHAAPREFMLFYISVSNINVHTGLCNTKNFRMTPQSLEIRVY